MFETILVAAAKSIPELAALVALVIVGSKRVSELATQVSARQDASDAATRQVVQSNTDAMLEVARSLGRVEGLLKDNGINGGRS